MLGRTRRKIEELKGRKPTSDSSLNIKKKAPNDKAILSLEEKENKAKELMKLKKNGGNPLQNSSLNDPQVKKKSSVKKNENNELSSIEKRWESLEKKGINSII